MLVIYGLGNNDTKYFDTKHNIGRVCLEYLAGLLGVNFQKKENFAYAKAEVSGQSVYLVYSLGYMNNSGEPLSAFCNYFKLNLTEPNSNLIVIQDDSDQLEARIKLLQAGGSAGHHGINSIYRNILGMRLEQSKIWRLKLGIRPPLNTQRSETFVLQKMGQSEIGFAKNIGQKVFEYLPDLAVGSFDKAQTSLNQNLTLDRI